MIIVSDTSPITNLIQINQLEILKSLFQKIIIPNSVFEELGRLPSQKEIIENLDWIEIQVASDKDKILLFEKNIDKGEAEAIVLALETKADYLLMDELKGRSIAEKNGLKIIGLLGVLLKAKKENIIPQIKPLLDALIKDASFRIHSALYSEVLKIAGEEN